MDNQLLGTTQPVMLCVTPSSSDSSMNDSGPALQVNAVKVPSNLMFTELYKVSECESESLLCYTQTHCRNTELQETRISFAVFVEHQISCDVMGCVHSTSW